MRLRNRAKSPIKVELQMTAMIDIVFLLLIFFVMTFRVATLEGDFSLHVPPAPAWNAPECMLPLPPLTVRLRADAQGELTSIQLGDRPLRDFDALRNMIVTLVGDERGPGSIAEEAEVVLRCDPELKYEYAIAAITATTGYVAEDGQIVPLIEKVRFAAP